MGILALDHPQLHGYGSPINQGLSLASLKMKTQQTHGLTRRHLLAGPKASLQL